MNKPINLVALKNCVDALQALLEDPYPWLASWQTLFAGRVQEFFDLTGAELCQRLYLPDANGVALVEELRLR